MTYKLFVDDVRIPPGPDWIIARTLDDAKDIISSEGSPYLISLDDDLNHSSETPQMLIDWLLCRAYRAAARGEQIAAVPRLSVHGTGPVGNVILQLINDFTKWASEHEKQTKKIKRHRSIERT